ncbi:MAG: M61 family metallopeptidase [Hyphomonadaceae bacterium]|nr:M61 family metallopeptidase [Hyphomonadaceae bacterium]
MSIWRSAVSVLLVVWAASTAWAQPERAPMPPVIEAPQDTAYPGGVIVLQIDATDTTRGIFRGRERIPLANDEPITLLYPQWLPGNHAPRGPINLFAGIEVFANGERVAWRRDPVNVYAFHVDPPAGARELEVTFQFLSPTQTSQGRVVMTPNMLNLQWNAMLLYPAGHFATQIRFRPSVTLPAEWTFASALDGAQTEGQTTEFAETDLETLVDSPMFAGRYARVEQLDRSGQSRVTLNIFAERPDQLDATDEQIRLHRNLIAQADRLFGARHFDHYDLLFALGDRLSGIGLEHHRSSENKVSGGYFTEWSNSVDDHDLLPHEYTHSWIGKYRRPNDLYTPGYDVPMRGELLWAYEGSDQYWGQVLTARSGLFTRQQGLDYLASVAATYQYRVGREWRSVTDTGNDPIIAARRPTPWVSYSRSEDYYSEGLLIWLDADTLIRQRTGGRRSLDDFARRFYGVPAESGSRQVNTFEFGDIVENLNAVMPYDWATFLREGFEAFNTQPPLDGIERGGYRLVYTEERSAYQRAAESYGKSANFAYSIGLGFGEGNTVTTVQWDSPAFNAGVTTGTQILAVNGENYSADVMRRAITAAKHTTAPIEMIVRNGDSYRTVELDYHDGLRYPHLERIQGHTDLLSRILAPR